MADLICYGGVHENCEVHDFEAGSMAELKADIATFLNGMKAGGWSIGYSVEESGRVTAILLVWDRVRAPLK